MSNELKQRAARLKEARVRHFPENATDAARAFGWNENTYRSHENGARGFGVAVGRKYAKAFQVPVAWLMGLTAAQSEDDDLSSLSTEIRALPPEQQTAVFTALRAILVGIKGSRKLPR